MASRPVGPYSAAERRCYQPLHARSPPTATRSCRYNSSAPGYGQLRHDARFHWVVTKTVPGNDERIKSVVRPVSIGRLARCVVSNDIAEHRSEPDVSLHHVLRSAAPYLCFTQVYTSVVVNSAFVSIRIAYTSFARVCNAFRPRRRRTYVPDSGLRTRPTDTKRYDTPDGQPHYIYIYIYTTRHMYLSCGMRIPDVCDAVNGRREPPSAWNAQVFGVFRGERRGKDETRLIVRRLGCVPTADRVLWAWIRRSRLWIDDIPTSRVHVGFGFVYSLYRPKRNLRLVCTHCWYRQLIRPTDVSIALPIATFRVVGIDNSICSHRQFKCTLDVGNIHVGYYTDTDIANWRYQ